MGKTGLSGARGKQGVDGISGVKGELGERGPEGRRGHTGVKGHKGEVITVKGSFLRKLSNCACILIIVISLQAMWDSRLLDILNFITDYC